MSVARRFRRQAGTPARLASVPACWLLRTLVRGLRGITALGGDHEADWPRGSILGNETHGAIAQGDVDPARVETVEATALAVAAINQAWSLWNGAADEVAVSAGAVGPVFAVETVCPAAAGISPLLDYR